MRTSARIGLVFSGLALLGLSGEAEAQGGPGGVGTSDASRSAYATRRAETSGTAARRSSAARGERPSPYTRGTVGTSPGRAHAEDDPLRPFSEQARRRSSAISPTRVTEAPAPPPEPRPQVRRNYYPGMRAGAHPNANIPRIRSHCIPSRSSVISGRVARTY